MWLQRLFPGAAQTVELTMRQIVLLAVAVLLAAIGTGFLLALIYLLLAAELGPRLASAVIAGAFFAGAGIFYFLARGVAARRRRAAAKRSAEGALTHRLADGLITLGFARESLAMRAAALVGPTMKPGYLVGATLLGGFLFGRRMRR